MRGSGGRPAERGGEDREEEPKRGSEEKKVYFSQKSKKKRRELHTRREKSIKKRSTFESGTDRAELPAQSA